MKEGIIWYEEKHLVVEMELLFPVSLHGLAKRLSKAFPPQALFGCQASALRHCCAALEYRIFAPWCFLCFYPLSKCFLATLDEKGTLHYYYL